MSLYPETVLYPSATLGPEVGEPIADFGDWGATLEAAYDATLEVAAYAVSLEAPDYVTTGELPDYTAGTEIAVYTSALEADYAATLEAELLLEVD